MCFVCISSPLQLLLYVCVTVFLRVHTIEFLFLQCCQNIRINYCENITAKRFSNCRKLLEFIYSIYHNEKIYFLLMLMQNITQIFYVIILLFLLSWIYLFFNLFFFYILLSPPLKVVNFLLLFFFYVFVFYLRIFSCLISTIFRILCVYPLFLINFLFAKFLFGFYYYYFFINIYVCVLHNYNKYHNYLIHNRILWRLRVYF